MIADVTPEGSRLRVGAPRQLFQQSQNTRVPGFAMDARAERFLLFYPAGPTDESAAPLTVILNWPSLVAKK